VFLLDTNVISELRKVRRRETDRTFVAWAETLNWSDLYLSAISIGEMEQGILRLEQYDSAQATVLRHWLTGQVLQQFSSRILPVDEFIAQRSAYLQVKRKRDLEDTLISATAYTHGFMVVTRNVADFDDAGVRVINPWTSTV
jgi:predicted nucleic acid-binding protein